MFTICHIPEQTSISEMKKLIILPLILIAFIFESKAQIEITPFTGYTFTY